MNDNIIKFPTAQVREAMFLERKWKECYGGTLKYTVPQRASLPKHSEEELRIRQKRKVLNFMFAYGNTGTSENNT